MEQILSLVLPSTVQTLQMVFFSTVFALLVGFPLGVLLSITNPYGIT
ncbi:MAG: methionine ABC transporter permease, partial [Spirochaetia bacterium]|nr:methionine ABC transporter permease [Spirochaetia bacterium]MCI6546732.1 methionine ABC transporter permease [Spirochaetia bacterium]